MKLEQRENDINKALDIYLKRGVKLHDEYSYAYANTNENLSEIWTRFKFDDNVKALSVLASGDQIFDMILKGLRNVATFDCNRIAEYFTLGIKKTAIECLDYYQFIEMFDYFTYGFNYEMEKYVISCAPSEYKKFWEELFYILKQKGRPAVSVFEFTEGDIREVLLNNRCNYLMSNNNFKKLQENLKNADITFNYDNIKNISKNYGKYDFIYISNIMDYFKEIYPEKSFDDALSSSLELFYKIYDLNLNEPGDILLTSFYQQFTKELFKKENSAKFTPKLISYMNSEVVGVRKGKVLRKNR